MRVYDFTEKNQKINDMLLQKGFTDLELAGANYIVMLASKIPYGVSYENNEAVEAILKTHPRIVELILWLKQLYNNDLTLNNASLIVSYYLNKNNVPYK